MDAQLNIVHFKSQIIMQTVERKRRKNPSSKHSISYFNLYEYIHKLYYCWNDCCQMFTFKIQNDTRFAIVNCSFFFARRFLLNFLFVCFYDHYYYLTLLQNTNFFHRCVPADVLFAKSSHNSNQLWFNYIN